MAARIYASQAAEAIDLTKLYGPVEAIKIAKGNSVVVVNGTYTYKTLFGLIAPGITAASLTWNIQSSHAPRDLCVAYNTPNCVTTCE
jgi:hypothetical protein